MSTCTHQFNYLANSIHSQWITYTINEYFPKPTSVRNKSGYIRATAKHHIVNVFDISSVILSKRELWVVEPQFWEDLVLCWVCGYHAYRYVLFIMERCGKVLSEVFSLVGQVTVWSNFTFLISTNIFWVGYMVLLSDSTSAIIATSTSVNLLLYY